MSNDKAGTPSCGIYVRIDDFSNMLDVIGWVRKLAFTVNRGSGYAKNMAVVDFAYSTENEERIRDIIPVARDNGLVAIVRGSFDPLGGDGVLIDEVDDIDTVRKAIGDEAITGVIAKTREDAVNAAKQGADYVSLAADPTLISWFTAQSDVMCLASGAHITADNCGPLAQAGASFVDVGHYILNHKKDIMQGTVNIMHAIDEATQTPDNVN